jgi:Periplasmic binding protein
VKVTAPIFEQAGVVAATPSATNGALAQNNWHTFIRGLASDDVQGPSVAGYLTDTLGAKKVCVVDDSTDYGLGLAKAVASGIGPTAVGGCTLEVKRGDKDFSAAVTQIKDAHPDAIFYGGYYAEAAIMVHQLRDAGVNATFASGDASNDPEFVKQAGAAARMRCCPARAHRHRASLPTSTWRRSANRQALSVPRVMTWRPSWSKVSTPGRSPGPRCSTIYTGIAVRVSRVPISGNPTVSSLTRSSGCTRCSDASAPRRSHAAQRRWEVKPSKAWATRHRDVLD